ncbi:MAG: hypothetical protein V7776_23665, partial [Halopseudomonas aestusnigri]
MDRRFLHKSREMFSESQSSVPLVVGFFLIIVFLIVGLVFSLRQINLLADTSEEMYKNDFVVSHSAIDAFSRIELLHH